MWEHLATTRGRLLTCLAAILEDPTTFPSSSNTSMPSDSSVCLIKPTLQMFAVALRIKTSGFYNLIHLHRKKRRKSAIEDKSAFPGNIGADFFETDDWAEFSKKKKKCSFCLCSFSENGGFVQTQGCTDSILLRFQRNLSSCKRALISECINIYQRQQHQHTDSFENLPTAGKGTNLCIIILVAGLSLLAFWMSRFSPT